MVETRPFLLKVDEGTVLKAKAQNLFYFYFGNRVLLCDLSWHLSLACARIKDPIIPNSTFSK